ncbi:MAG: putative lipid II flippase FtsW [bacterium]
MFAKILRNPIWGISLAPSKTDHADHWFIAALVVICGIGVLMVYSSSYYTAYIAQGDPFYYLKRHFIRLGIGLVLLLLAYHTDYHHLRRLSGLLLGVSGAALFAVLFTGADVARSFGFGAFNVQPSEFARIALIIFLADWCSRNSHRLENFWSGFAPIIAIIGVITYLVFREPSFSMASLILISAGIVLFFAGANTKHILSIGGVALILGAIAVIQKPYRWARIKSFLNPLADPLGAGYQSNQSQIAVGSGQWAGVGFGQSGQKFGYLPEAHSDFIYSIHCEETGFIGAVILLLLFGLLIWRGYAIALKSTDQFGFLLAAGLTFCIALTVAANVAVVLALVPVTGLPLPFISYGGSALIAELIACGIILNISKHSQSPESI